MQEQVLVTPHEHKSRQKNWSHLVLSSVALQSYTGVPQKLKIWATMY